MKTPKVVLDTNIYLSGYLYSGNPLTCLELAREGKILVYISRPILLELADKLYNKFNWKEVDVRDLVENVSSYTEIVSPSTDIFIIKKDKSDNKILELAKEVNADFIVTGDKKHILPLKKFGKAQILTATDFVKMLGSKN